MPLNRINLGLDIDEVLADWINPFTNLTRELYGKPGEGVLPSDFYLSNYNLTSEEYEAAKNITKDTPRFWESLPAIVEPSDIAIFTNDYRFRVYFITSRYDALGPPVEDQTASWLRSELLINYPTVIVSHDKARVADGLDLQYMFDDKPENLLDIWEKHGIKCYLKNHAHNRWFENCPFERKDTLQELKVSILKDYEIFGGARGNPQDGAIKLLEGKSEA